MLMEVYEKNLFKDIISQIQNHKYSKYISSVVLTGSFGRNEPTYEMHDDGFELKSDVEIALVFEKNQDCVYQLISDVSSVFKEDLNFMTIHKHRVEKIQNYNYAVGTPKYKTLFMFDFINSSRTLFGEDLISDKFIDLKYLDLYEAKRIVANRIAEMIHVSENNDFYSIFQWKCKIVLAVISAYLIIKGKYVSSYFGQRDAIKANENEFLEIFGREFLDIYYNSFSFLRENGSLFEVSDSILKESVKQFYEYYNPYNSKKSLTTNFSRKLKYITKYFKNYRKFNVLNIEDRILNDLIIQYFNDNTQLTYTSEMWYKILY